MFVLLTVLIYLKGISGKDTYELSREARESLGVSLIKSSDKAQAATTIMADPSQLDSVITNLAKKAGISDIPGEALLDVLDYAEANTPKSDKRAHTNISIMRAFKLGGFESSVYTMEQLIHTNNTNNIPPARENFDVGITFKKLYGDNADDVINTIRVLAFEQNVASPQGTLSVKDEDFRDDFSSAVELYTDDPGFFSSLIDFSDRPDQVPNALWKVLTPKAKEQYKRVLSDAESVDEHELNELDDLSKAAIESEGAYIVTKRKKDGGLYRFVVPQNAAPFPIVYNDGTKSRMQMSAMKQGINIRKDLRTKNGHNWGNTADSMTELSDNIFKGRKRLASFDKKYRLKPFKQDLVAAKYTKDILSKKYDGMSFKHMVSNAARDTGLPREFAPLLAQQLMLESGWLGKGLKKFDPKAVKTVTLKSGKTVDITGYAQVTTAKAERLKAQGYDVTTVKGATYALAAHMKELLNQGYKVATPAQRKDRRFLGAVYKYALKNYNGGGFYTRATLEQGLKGRGSTGAFETTRYVSWTLSPYFKLSQSEYTGTDKKTGKSKGMSFEDYKKLRQRIQESSGTAQALADAGFNVRATSDYLTVGDTTSLFRTVKDDKSQ